MQQNALKAELKNFGFLVPHLHEFEGELRDLLIEIDKLIERKKIEWETELHNVESNLQQKIRENQELQNLISLKEIQLKEAFGKLNLIESTFIEGNPEEELNLIKNKVDRMRRSYENLQKKYHRQLDTEKEQSSMALRKLEKANSFLQEELNEIKETSQKQMNSLTKQLKEERSKTERLEKRCQKLQKELEGLTKHAEHERSDSHSLEGVYQSRCMVLERELEMTKQLSKTQIAEYEQVQRTAFERAQELHRLNTELTSTRNELAASSDAMCRMEHLVLQHLVTLSKASGQGTICPTSSSIRSTPLSRKELEVMVKEMQSKLSNVDREFTDKFNEIRRLESACQTASTTIHRLVEARTQSMQQVASLSTVLTKAIDGLQSITKRVDNFERVLSEKLYLTKNGLVKVNQDLTKLLSSRATRMPSKKAGTNLETGTQTHEAVAIEAATQTMLHGDSVVDLVPQHRAEHVLGDWFSQTENLQTVISQLTEERADLQFRLNHQLELAERLQKENLALTDLLTGAEQFNRTRISCSPPVPQRKLAPTTTVTASRESLISTGVQVNPLPEHDKARSTQRRPQFPFRKSKSSTASPDSGAPLLESQFYSSDSQLSPVRFRPLSPLSVQTSSDTVTVVDSPQQPIARGASSTNLDADETVIASVDTNDRSSSDSPAPSHTHMNRSPPCGLVEPKTSGDSLDGLSPASSPSEYENFALPRSQLRPVLKSSRWHARHGTGATAATNLVPAEARRTVTTRYNRSVHIRLPPNDAIGEAEGIEKSETVRVQAKYKLDQPAAESNGTLMASGDPSLPQACSTVRLPLEAEARGFKSDQFETDYGNGDDDDDVSVSRLAAKFLANEKKHSTLLEQQIDAHLEVLKSQLGIGS